LRAAASALSLSSLWNLVMLSVPTKVPTEPEIGGWTLTRWISASPIMRAMRMACSKRPQSLVGAVDRHQNAIHAVNPLVVREGQ
jgi:hypothetical protein